MEKILIKLAKKARMEKVPHVNVVDSVMQRISTQPQAAAGPDDRAFVWMASLSTAAAIAIGTFAIYAYFTWTNPLSEMSEAISWVL